MYCFHFDMCVFKTFPLSYLQNGIFHVYRKLLDFFLKITCLI